MVVVVAVVDVVVGAVVVLLVTSRSGKLTDPSVVVPVDALDVVLDDDVPPPNLMSVPAVAAEAGGLWIPDECIP